MNLSKEFLEAVEAGKVTRVRIMIKNSMLVDKTGKSCEEMLAYAADRMADLYDEYDNESFKRNCGEWDEDYMNDQLVKVVDNFSRERIAHIKEVILYLYKPEPQKAYSSSNNGENNWSSTSKVVGGAATVVGAGMIVGGIVSASTGLAIAGAVVGVAGIVVIATGIERS